ncbi:MAG: SoxR reducing system RseC family protein [Deltaproteobacteria bacterium]|nr:SoxR reducing system RseC family protein [Candidatus Zymogenaceae bacterium]
MISETGKVIEAKDGTALVLVERSAACQGCAAQGVCHTLGGGTDARITVNNDLNAKVGDLVELSIRESSLVSASFIVYMVPVAGLFAVAALAGWLAPRWGWDPEASAAAGAVVGLAASLFGIRLFHPVLDRSDTLKPVITRIVRETHGDEEEKN